MSDLYLTNKLLIAMPSLTNPTFARSVTYICEHNRKGAVGLIINRPLDISLDSALAQMNINAFNDKAPNIPLFFGGPVQQDKGFVIHKPRGRKWETTLQPNEDIAITTSKDILQAIAKGNGPKDMIVALGYTGWESNQLEQEILTNNWIVCPVNSSIIFNTPQEYRWQMALSSLGINEIQLTHEYGHA